MKKEEKLILIQSFLKPNIGIILQNNNIVNIFFDTEEEEGVGNIYKGRITNITPGINACFVSLGNSQSGFLNFNDIPDNLKNKIKVGNYILVKIKKSGLKNKLPQLSAYITIAGKYTILLPFENTIKISSKITEEDTKEVLINTISSIRAELAKKYNHPSINIQNLGFIARTSSKEVEIYEIYKDMEILVKIWINILNDFENSKHEKLIYTESYFPIKIIREYFDNKTQVIVDNKEIYQKLKEYISLFSNEYLDKIIFYDISKTNKSLIDYYDLKIELSKYLEKKVWLKSGGSIIIQTTEMGTFIDVNSGSYIGSNPIETSKNTNIEAAIEIAKQIKIRNLTGIILIDFLKIPESTQYEIVKKQIIEVLKEHLKDDKIKTHILGFTNLGILEITRQRTENDIYSRLATPCEFCNSVGYIINPKYQVLQIINNINSTILKTQNFKEKNIYLEISSYIIPYLIEYILNFEYDKILKKNNVNLILKSFKSVYYISKYDFYKLRFYDNISTINLEDFPQENEILELEVWNIPELDTNNSYSIYKGYPVIVKKDKYNIFNKKIEQSKLIITKIYKYYLIETKALF
ncbi:MAG: ribonuclease E/G [bacterium]|jgi:ribonuclease G